MDSRIDGKMISETDVIFGIHGQVVAMISFAVCDIVCRIYLYFPIIYILLDRRYPFRNICMESIFCAEFHHVGRIRGPVEVRAGRIILDP